MWGNNNLLDGDFAIINFVFWVGIGHAGTLISAIIIFAQTKMENRYCAFCRSDDNICSNECRIFPVDSRWSSVACWIFIPYPNQHQFMGKFYYRLCLGCICGINLLYSFFYILVCWIDSRFCCASRQSNIKS